MMLEWLYVFCNNRLALLVCTLLIARSNSQTQSGARRVSSGDGISRNGRADPAPAD